MPNQKDLFYSFWTSVVLTAFPQATIKFKNESKLMRFLGFILKPVNCSYMNSYITTLGTKVYVPSRQWMENNYAAMLNIVPHEFMHMWDYTELKRKFKVNVFALLWLSPQILSVFSLLAILAVLSPWFLFMLVFLFAGLPWSSKYRTDLESSGYAINMLVSSFSIGPRYNAMEDAESLSEYFTSSAYYWMCRDKAKVVDLLVRKHATLPQTHEGAKRIYAWLKAQSNL